MELVRITFGTGPHTITHTLLSSDIDFWSPYLRKLREASTSDSSPITLPDIDAETFSIFLLYISTNEPFFPASIDGITSEGIPVAIKVWLMAQKFGGSTLRLRDVAMRKIYSMYTPGEESAVITELYPTPRVMRLVFANTMLNLPLSRFLFAVLCRVGTKCAPYHSSYEEAKKEWATLLEDIPYLKRLYKKMKSADEEWRLGRLSPVDRYMSALGDATEKVPEEVDWNKLEGEKMKRVKERWERKSGEKKLDLPAV